MLVFAPLVRGGNRPLAQLVLELIGLGLLVYAMQRPRAGERFPAALLAGLVGLAGVPLLHALPLPAAAWAALPGRDEAAAALAAAGVTAGWMSVATVPHEAERALWALLPPLGLFLFAVRLPGADLRRLVWVFVGMAALQAVLGLLQYGAGPESALRFGYEPYGDSAIGTYANRSHLAGMLGMALPIALAMLASVIFGLQREAPRRHHGAFGGLRAMAQAGTRANRLALWAAVCVALILGIVFARSRTGIAVAMVGLVLTAVLLMRNFGGAFAGRMMTAVLALGGVLAVTVGLTPVFARFGLDATQDLRWPMLDVTLDLAMKFFPLGSGAGSFVDVFRTAHPAEIGGEVFVNHAHNDFAEWWMEGGVAAAAVMLLLAAALVQRWRVVWRIRDWSVPHMLQLGAGVGLVMLLLFGLTDYNLRIPANQIYFALLAAVFFHCGPVEVAHAGRRRRTSRREEQGASGASAGGTVPAVQTAVDAWDDVPAPVAARPAGPRVEPVAGSNPFAE